MVPALQREPMLSPSSNRQEGPDGQESMWLKLYREVFLKVVETHYWDAITQGIMPRKTWVTRALLNSTKESLDVVHNGLSDWEIIERHVFLKGTRGLHRLM